MARKLMGVKQDSKQMEDDRKAVLEAENPLQKAIELVSTDTYEEEPEDVEDEQPIIEASQEKVKAALQVLLTRENSLLAHLYAKHAEYNAKYFGNNLSRPLITVEKLSNKTLGDYRPGRNASGIENHIRFNMNFVALNPVPIIDNVLVHEMIHQWQDEVLYVKKGEQPKFGVQVPSIGQEALAAMAVSYETGFPVTFTEGEQLKRPREWHTKHFKAMACHVGIAAKGDKCYQPPVVMPESKSYNRKYACGCIASNGKPHTVWSTREVHAICTVCEQPFVELRKSGKLVEVKLSHVERPGEDAVRNEMMKKGYNRFKRLLTKAERDSWVNDLGFDFESGFYQKEHNSYKDGFRYWVAYSEDEPDDDLEEAPEEAPEEREYSAENAQDILDLYKELGSTRKVAERLGIGQSTLMGKAKKFGVNFKEGRIYAKAD